MSYFYPPQGKVIFLLMFVCTQGGLLWGVLAKGVAVSTRGYAYLSLLGGVPARGVCSLLECVPPTGVCAC